MTSPDKPGSLPQWIVHQINNYTLLDSLRGRRSRRFGAGMQIDHGPFTYTSDMSPTPISEDEEAALAFAACGLTGYALADLAYGRGQGGSMLDGLVGRTVSSPDSVNAVSIVVINDEATYILKRPQDFAFDEIPDLIGEAKAGKLTALYQRMRVKIRDGRTTIPVVPGLNFNINKWSLYAKGSTYFLPVNELTAIYINALLEMFDPTMGLYVVDERNLFQPPGIGRFAKSRGGYLDDNPEDGRVVTIQGLEMSFAEAVAVEQGMALQNLGLMTQALGLGGFANYARDEYAWLQALGFRMQSMRSSRYVGAPRVLGWILQLIGRDFMYPYAVGLERDGDVILHPYTPPYYPSMREAVLAFVDHKFGKTGVYRDGAKTSDWRNPESVSAEIKPPSEVAIEATIAYCDYVFRRYGKFPAYSAPFRNVIGYQATRVDPDFYDRFFKPEALTETQRERSAFDQTE